MKKILYLCRRHPAELLKSLEMLQSAVVSSIFEQQVSLLFRDDGVLQLSDGLDAAPQDQVESWTAMLAETDAYGISHVYVCSRSLAARNLDESRLLVTAQPVSEPDQARLFASHDAVVSD